METCEHELIRQKIETVTGLPEGYTPNLDSKWELLEASLKPAEKKRPLFWMSMAGAAAALLLVSAIVFMSMEDEVPVHQAGSTVTQPARVKAMQPERQPVERLVQQPVKRHRRTKHEPAPVLQEHKEGMIVQREIIDTNGTQEILFAEKAARFVEMDFSEPVISDRTPSETVIASQRFKFKIGIGGQSSVSTGGSGSRGLFRKKFN